MSRDHSDLVVERLAPDHQLSPFASPSRTILPEEDHADEPIRLAQRGLVAMTDQTVVTSSQAAAVPASLSCVTYESSAIGGGT